MNIRYLVELSQAGREQLTAIPGGGKAIVRKISTPKSYFRPMPARATKHWHPCRGCRYPVYAYTGIT